MVTTITVSVCADVDVRVERMGSAGRVTVGTTGKPNTDWQADSCAAGSLLTWPATWYRQGTRLHCAAIGLYRTGAGGMLDYHTDGGIES